MKIKRLNLYTYILYIMLAAYMLGPALFFKVGVPRIDNPLTLIFVLLGFVVFFLESKHIPRKIFCHALRPDRHVHLACHPHGYYVADADAVHGYFVFYGDSGFLLLVLPSIETCRRPFGNDSKFLIVFTLFIAVPPFAELATGIQFVSASDELAIDEGSLKGLFFNPNNLAATAVCLAPAILFSSNSRTKTQRKTTGLGFVPAVGHGHFRQCIAYRHRLLPVDFAGLYGLSQKRFYYSRRSWFAGVGVVDDSVTRDCGIFAVAQRQPVFGTFSSRVYLFLYDLGSDNSVSYRQEIYNYFWNNPPLLLTGYGPKTSANISAAT